MKGSTSHGSNQFARADGQRHWPVTSALRAPARRSAISSGATMIEMVNALVFLLEPFIGLQFVIAGSLMLRQASERLGAVAVTLGGLLSLGGAVYDHAFAPNNFVPADQFSAPSISPHSVYVLGLLLCAVGTVVHASMLRR